LKAIGTLRRCRSAKATAVAVATGAANAQDPFLNGKIRLFGDQQSLMAAQPVFAALDHVFSTVRDRTSYE